jgi:hypothetical protein
LRLAGLICDVVASKSRRRAFSEPWRTLPALSVTSIASSSESWNEYALGRSGGRGDRACREGVEEFATPHGAHPPMPCLANASIAQA